MTGRFHQFLLLFLQLTSGRPSAINGCSPSQPWFIWKRILPAEGCPPSKLRLVSQKRTWDVQPEKLGEGDLIFIVFLFGLELPSRNSNLFIFRGLRRSKWIHFPILDGGIHLSCDSSDLVYFLAWFHWFIWRVTQNSATPQPPKQVGWCGLIQGHSWIEYHLNRITFPYPWNFADPPGGR